MNIKKEFETLVKYGLHNKDNKKEIINMCSWLVSCLNSTEKKSISKTDLEKISGGFNINPHKFAK